MTTLQEQFKKDHSDKNTKIISACGKYLDTKFTNRDLDLSEYKNLQSLNLANNKLTSVDFLNTIANPKKLEELWIYNNNIQSTSIEIFGKFTNLRYLKIGTMKSGLSRCEYNKFYGSLESYRNLTKLESICIEATDVNEGLEFLPFGVKKLPKVDCQPNGTDAKCSIIQEQLRPYDYDIHA